MMLKAPTARILVIDDEPAVVDILVTCLREEGYGVLGAETGDEGFTLAIPSRPELVLLCALLRRDREPHEVMPCRDGPCAWLFRTPTSSPDDEHFNRRL